MKNSFKLITILLMIVFAFFLACETEEEEEVSPLVGTWVMNNMEQSSTFIAAEDMTLIPGMLVYTTGDTIGSGSMDWATFQALGVEATVVVSENETFALTAHLPQASDTLQVAPTILELTDAGTWVHNEDLGTFVLDGGIYDIGGVLTLTDTTMTLAYNAVDTSVAMVLPVENPMTGLMLYFDIVTDVYSSTVLGWIKQ
ncbi:MAG: hypothetical protein ISS81_07585 [Candidatus Marinimicrobia bacterium]|nr:hypothetical protein [Candidatus Neomarinimicrobiota bacterium]